MSLTSYRVNICDAFILPSRAHCSSPLRAQRSQYSTPAPLTPTGSSHTRLLRSHPLSEQPATSICSTKPVAPGSWGFPHFSSKRLNYSISSPKESNQIPTNRHSPRALPFFLNIGEKVHDSNGCVHSLHMCPKKTQAMTCELGAALAHMTTQFLPLNNKYYCNINKTIKDIQSLNIWEKANLPITESKNFKTGKANTCSPWCLDFGDSRIIILSTFFSHQRW